MFVEIINDMKDRFSLTPKQIEIEDIIDNHLFSVQSESADLLRLLSSMNEELKSTLHYHGGAYVKHLIESAEILITKIKG